MFVESITLKRYGVLKLNELAFNQIFAFKTLYQKTNGKCGCIDSVWNFTKKLSIKMDHAEKALTSNDI